MCTEKKVRRLGANERETGVMKKTERVMTLRYVPKGHWPALAWLAELREGSSEVVVRHGPGVESRDEWFCEAVWDGEFDRGEFDATDIVAGSGGRLRGKTLVLVSSGSTVDRLQSTCDKGVWLVSNSLACLLAVSRHRFAPEYRHYHRDFLSIIKGIRKYRAVLPTEQGRVRFTYFDNLHWDGQSLTTIEKPGAERRFERFAEYRAFLESSLSRMAGNMGSSKRARRYEFLATLSTGYDSPTVTALAKPFGLERVVCFHREGNLRDRGSSIAPYLGVEPVLVPVDAWRDLDRPEIPFIAADSFGEEVHHRSAEGGLRAKVLLSGYHGDKVWDKHNRYVGEDLVRGDVSGMSLTEYRLQAGFIHCAVPFLGARSAADLKAISNSPEMSPWDVGGDYTRPICRRIVEEAGVPRTSFGTSKSFASRWHFASREFLTESSREDYLAWLSRHRGRWWRRARLPPSTSLKLDAWRLQAINGLGEALVSLPGLYRSNAYRLSPIGAFVAYRDPNTGCTPWVPGLRRYVFAWAAEGATRLYEE